MNYTLGFIILCFIVVNYLFRVHFIAYNKHLLACTRCGRSFEEIFAGYTVDYSSAYHYMQTHENACTGNGNAQSWEYPSSSYTDVGAGSSAPNYAGYNAGYSGGYG